MVDEYDVITWGRTHAVERSPTGWPGPASGY